MKHLLAGAIIFLCSCNPNTKNDTAPKADHPKADPIPKKIIQIVAAELGFAALLSDGSVQSWGDVSLTPSAPVATRLLSGVEKLYSCKTAFAALKTDGTAVTWGNVGSAGGNPTAAEVGLIDIKLSNNCHFAALKNDGSVVIRTPFNEANGTTLYNQVKGNLSSDVTKIVASDSSFAALKMDGTVVAWGEYAVLASATENASAGLVDVTDIVSHETAFAALRSDGSVVTWGEYSSPDDIEDNIPLTIAAEFLESGVSSLAGGNYAFTALKPDGTAVVWGWTAPLAAVLTNVVKIFSLRDGFAFLKSDGLPLLFNNFDGASWSDGPNALDSAKSVASSESATAAVLDDGSVIFWGDDLAEASFAVAASHLSAGVSGVVASSQAFAARKADGTLITWGASEAGGDSSSVKLQ